MRRRNETCRCARRFRPGQKIISRPMGRGGCERISTNFFSNVLVQTHPSDNRLAHEFFDYSKVSNPP